MGTPAVHVTEHTAPTVEQVLAAARDFSDRRAQMWPDVHLEHFEVHELGDIFHAAGTWEIHATPNGDRTRVEIIGVRNVKGAKGAIIGAVIRLGIARRAVADHRRHLLTRGRTKRSVSDTQPPAGHRSSRHVHVREPSLLGAEASNRSRIVAGSFPRPAARQPRLRVPARMWRYAACQSLPSEPDLRFPVDKLAFLRGWSAVSGAAEAVRRVG